MNQQTAIIEKTSFQVDSDNPYLGLASFEEVHKDFFFGRDDEIQSLQRLLHRDVLTVLFGVSGLGKTSLLQAGLFPLLRKQQYLPIWIRLSYDNYAPHPETQIKHSVSQAVQKHCLDTPSPESGERLWEYFHRVPFWSKRNRLLTPVLVFDQFEELFTLGCGVNANREFLQQLADLAENQIPESVSTRLHDSDEDLPYDYGQPAVKIILSLREDYLAQLEDLRRYIPSLTRNRYRLLPMNGEQAFQAVKNPAKSLVDEEVAESIVRFVAGDDKKLLASGETPELVQLMIEPALLSLVSRELNQRRLSNEDVRISAKLLELSRDQILTDFYQRSLKGLSKGIQRFIEDELLTSSGYRSTKAQEDALQMEGVSEAALLSLVDRRLLRLEERLGMPHLELIHDVMASVVKKSREERRRYENNRLLKRQLFIGGSTVIGILIAFAVFVWIMYGWWQEAETQQELAVKAEQRANLQLARNYMNQGITKRDINKDPFKASHYFYQAEKFSGLAENQVFSQIAQFAADIAARKLPRRLLTLQHKSQVNGALFSADQQWVLTWSKDGTARVWNSTSGEALAEPMVHKSSVNGAVFSADQQRVLTWSNDGTARIWDSASGQPMTEPMVHKRSVIGALFSADQQRVLTWSADGTARIWNSASGQPMTEPMVHKNRVNGALFSADQQRVLTWSADGTAQIWDSASGQPMTEPMVHKKSVKGALFSADQQRVLTWNSDERYGDGAARIWDSASGRPLTKPMVHEDQVLGAVFSVDQQRVLSWSANGTVRNWDSVSGQPITEPMVHKNSVNGALFSADQQRVLTWSADGTARIWDSASGRPLTKPMVHEDQVLGAVFSVDQQRVLTWSGDDRYGIGEVRIWDSASGHPITEPMVHKNSVYGALFSADQQRVLTWSADGTARIWDSTSGRPFTKPMVHKKSVNGAMFSADQQRVLTWSGDERDGDGVVRIWDSVSGQPLTEPMIHSKSVNGAVFSVNQQRVLTWSGDERYGDGAVRVWDSASGQPVTEPIVHRKSVKGAVFSADQQRVLTWSADGTARVWDIASGQPLTEPMVHKNSVKGALFSADQQRVLTWSADGTARIWDSASGQPLTEPMLHKNSVNGALFSADHQRVLTWSRDGTARVWDSANGQPLTETMVHKYSVNGALFSADQQRVLTWSRDGTARVWNSASGQPLTEPIVHRKSVKGAVFSADQQRVLTWSADGTARVWDSARGRPLTEPMIHKYSVKGALFSADQQRVLTWSADGTARIWDSASGQPLTEPMLHKNSVNGALFSTDQQRVLTWSGDKTSRVWNISADLDFPKQHLGLLLEVKSWKQLNELGDVQEFSAEDWQKKWNEYEPIAVEHLKHCSYPHANWYIDRMIHKQGSCAQSGAWLQKVNTKILPEVKRMYAGFCLERGNQLLFGEHYKQAKQSFNTVLELQPESAKVYDRLGWMLIKSGENPEQGIEYAKKSLGINPFQQPNYALNTLATGYEDTGKNALTSSAFLKLARAHVHWQQYAMAMDAYNQVLKLPADKESQVELEEYKKSLELLIKSFNKEKNYHKITHYYEQALQSDFNDSKSRALWSNSLARTLIESDINIVKGVKYAKHSIELDPNYHAIDTLALGYIKQGKYDQAIKILKQTLQKQPNKTVLKDRLQQAEEEKKVAVSQK